jgi:hypothetical protein
MITQSGCESNKNMRDAAFSSVTMVKDDSRIFLSFCKVKIGEIFAKV